MFAIKELDSGKFAKLPEIRLNQDNLEMDWILVNEVDKAQQYTTLEHANEIAFWHLDLFKKWVIVDIGTGKEYEKKSPKYIPM